MKIGVMGCTGYAGKQLTNILLHHKDIDIVALSSNTYAGKMSREIFGNHEKLQDIEIINSSNFVKEALDYDLVFTAIPHMTSMELINELLQVNSHLKIIDLSADYRFKDKDSYEAWYDCKHIDEKNLKKSEYGLCELNRKKLKRSQIIGNPGCYPTSVLLGLMPVLDDTLVDLSSIIIDSKSGYTGAGIKPEGFKLFSEAVENSYPYKISNHRHTGEIEFNIKKITKKDIVVQFTPNLIPVKRGIISNIYINLTRDFDYDDIYKMYKTYYEKEKFIVVHKGIPKLSDSVGTNECHIGISVDKRSSRLIITSTIDNLIKGAAGAAIQNMNIVCGFNESEGLELIKTNL